MWYHVYHHDPVLTFVVRPCRTENWAFEIVVYLDQLQTDYHSLMLHEELLKEVPDGFLIYSNDDLGTIRPINRLVKFAAGETVLVVPSGDLSASVRSGWIEAAAHAMVLNQVRSGAPRRCAGQFI